MMEDHRDSEWIAGCENCRREFLDACDRAGFSPQIAYTSDEPVVQPALVAAGMGVTTMPGLVLRTHWAPGIQATKLPDFRGRVYLTTYGDPPDPPRPRPSSPRCSTPYSRPELTSLPRP
jgi:DNA-binding transcriptional LysR family regulator